MTSFYFYSFFPVIGLSVAMFFGINKKKEYGGRSKALLLSTLLIVFIGILSTILTYTFSNSSLIVQMFFVGSISILYSLAIMVLEYSIHSQRIKLSFLKDDVQESLKLTKIMHLISIALVVLSAFLYFVLKFERDIFILFLIIMLLQFSINTHAIFVVFSFRKGVLRRRRYPFVVTAIVMFYYTINIFVVRAEYFTFSLSLFNLVNLVYLVRCFEEYVFFRTEHMQYMIRHEAKLKKENSKIINKVILSDKKEDSLIIKDVVMKMLDNINRELIIESQGITGILTFRLFNGYFRLDSEDMIHGYCTPLQEVLSIKQISYKAITKKIMETKYKYDDIMSSSVEELKDFGAKYLKRIIVEKTIIEVDEIPKSYRGLQKLIVFVPIFNEDKIAGFQVVFKSDYENFFYFEQKALKANSYILNTIFSIVNGKQVQEERNRLMGEMNIAKEIQTSIVPKTIELEGYSVACNMETATEVGGDAYDFISNKYGNYFSIGDVSGHGLPSGITALIFLASLQASLETSEELGSKLEVDKAYDIVNRVLCTINRDRIGSDKFMTGNIFCENDGKFSYAGAHEVAIQYSKKDNQVILHKGCTERTAFLGLSEFIKSGTSLGSLEMESGDVLVLYTDGVIEAKNEDSTQYGVENVSALLFENQDKEPAVILELLKQEVVKHAEKGDIKQNGGSLSDDISIVIIKRT